MIIKSKKAQEAVNFRLVAIIIAIVLVGAIFIFLMNVDINKYLRYLPGYNVPEEDEEIITGEDKIISDIQVVAIVSEKDKKLFVNGEETSFKITEDYKNLIYVKSRKIIWDSNINIGDIEKSGEGIFKIKLYDDLFKPNSELVSDVGIEFITANLDFLKSLDNSIIYGDVIRRSIE